MRLGDVRAWLRQILPQNEDFATIIRGAGLALVIRFLASIVGYASMILLARWMGSTQFGHYRFAFAGMMLLAYPASLGLPGAAVRFGAQYAAAGDWPNVIGLIRFGSWIAFGCGTAVAIVGVSAVFYLQAYLDAGYVAPLMLAILGVPAVSLITVRSEAIRAVGWLGLGWAPLQLGPPLTLLLLVGIIILTGHELHATLVMGATILGYAAMLILQHIVLRARLATKARLQPSVNAAFWLAAAIPFLWIQVAYTVLYQSGAIIIGLFLTAQDVAIYGAAAATSLLVTFLLQATNALSAPKFAALHAQGRHLDLQHVFTNVVRWTFWPSLALTVALIAFGTPILRLFGPDFARGHLVLAILAITELANTAIGPVANLLSMTGHHASTARVAGIGAAVYVVLALLATPLAGIEGAALAFAAVSLLCNLLLAALVVRKLEIYPSLLGQRRRPQRKA